MAKLIHDINSFRNQICLRTYLFSLLLKKQLSQLFSYFEFLYIIIKSFLRCSFEMNEPVINVPNLKPLKLKCSRWRWPTSRRLSRARTLWSMKGKRSPKQSETIATENWRKRVLSWISLSLSHTHTHIHILSLSLSLSLFLINKHTISLFLCLFIHILCLFWTLSLSNPFFPLVHSLYLHSIYLSFLSFFHSNYKSIFISYIQNRNFSVL